MKSIEITGLNTFLYFSYIYRRIKFVEIYIAGLCPRNFSHNCKAIGTGKIFYKVYFLGGGFFFSFFLCLLSFFLFFKLCERRTEDRVRSEHIKYNSERGHKDQERAIINYINKL